MQINGRGSETENIGRLLSKLLISQEVQQEASCQIAGGEGILTKEERLEMARMVDWMMKRKGNNEGRFIPMKSILLTIFLSGVVLLGGSSCATVPREPLPSGEIRLLSIDVVGAGIEANSSFAVNVFFEAGDNSKIKRACFYEPGEEPSCFDVSNGSYLTLGAKRAFQVYLPGLNAGSHWVRCYAEYIRDGETQKTNVVFTQITTGVHVGLLENNIMADFWPSSWVYQENN